MDRLFAPRAYPTTPVWSAYPPLNVWEDKENIFVEAELPGLKLEDLNIEMEPGEVLSIKGERKPPELPEKVWHLRELGYGAFARTVELPYPVEAGKVEARFENGVLHIELPRAESAKPRRIPVKAG